jgi:hypothetical protein
MASSRCASHSSPYASHRAAVSTSPFVMNGASNFFNLPFRPRSIVLSFWSHLCKNLAYLLMVCVVLLISSSFEAIKSSHTVAFRLFGDIPSASKKR